MLYVIGGASRSGKSSVAHLLLNHYQVPFLSLDYLRSGFHYGVPQLGILHDQPYRENSKRLWPFLRPMMYNIADQEPAYLVEGDALLPELVGSLASEMPGRVRACFMGYPQADPEEKFQQVRNNPGAVNNWIVDKSDAELRHFLRDMIALSREIQIECMQHGVPFIDTSRDFQVVLRKTCAFLTQGCSVLPT